MRTLAQLARLRPFLWLWVICLASLALALTWEAGTSYDDGGLGTASFVVLHTVGLPFMLPLLGIGAIVPSSWPVTPIGVTVALLVGSAFYLTLDRVLDRWARASRLAAHVEDRGAGA
jgi:hypothetical protein